jgi:transcriptional antiterminator NusG
MTSQWYIVHTYSNFEKKAAEEIKRQATIQGLADLIEDVMVPTEEVVEVRRGHKVNAERKFLPGYILVKADLTNEAYHLIKNVPKVTGFLGQNNKPMPLGRPRSTGSSIRSRKGRNAPSRRSPSRSASRCASPMVRSRRSTAQSKKWTRTVRA